MTKVHFTFDTKSTAVRITNAVKAAMPELVEQVRKDCNFYAPQRTGVLIAKSNIDTDSTGKCYKIIWDAKNKSDVSYADYVFKGVSKKGKKLKYSKYPNANAQSHWTHKAKSVKLMDWKLMAEKLLKEKL